MESYKDISIELPELIFLQVQPVCELSQDSMKLDKMIRKETSSFESFI